MLCLRKFLGLTSGEESAEERLCRVGAELGEKLEEKNGVLSRRNFLISIPTILAVRKALPKEFDLADMTWSDAIVSSTFQPICASAIIITDDLVLERYREEIFRQVRGAFVFGQML